MFSSWGFAALFRKLLSLVMQICRYVTLIVVISPVFPTHILRVVPNFDHLTLPDRLLILAFSLIICLVVEFSQVDLRIFALWLSLSDRWAVAVLLELSNVILLGA